MSAKTRQPDAPAVPTGKTDWAALDAMTADEIEIAARGDPDCPPPRDDQILRQMSVAKRIRLGLRLSRQAFAERYHIPIATLTAWERHQLAPDAVATTFLQAIATDPDGLAAAIAKSGRGSRAAE